MYFTDCNLIVKMFLPEPPTYAESISGAVDIRDEDDDQLGTIGDMMFTPMYTYVYDYRFRCPPAYSEVSLVCSTYNYSILYPNVTSSMLSLK